MNREPTTAEKLRALRWDIAHSAAISVFSQLTFFGSVFVLFLSELGLSKTAIGSLLSLIPFTGLVALFIAPAVGRFGYKRTFLIFWGSRKAVTALLLLTPWVNSRWGSEAASLFVAAIVALFAIFRAVGMTARLPWVQEFVPNAVRGKFSAVSSIASQLAALAAVMVAGYVVEQSTDLNGFMLLFAVGVAFGAIGLWAVSHVPGGAPTKEAASERASRRDLFAAARDRNFVVYLVGVGFVALATGPLTSFLPLFMQEQVGLSSGNVVRLQNGVLLGGLVSSYLWGWLADRYGSKPVMMSGIYLQFLLPVFWLLMPRQSSASLYAALSIAVLQGLANVGWGIGSARLRFVSVIPAEKSRDYQALFFAWIGIVGGLGQVFGGWLLDVSEGLTGQVLGYTLDSFSILFLGSIVLLVAAGLLLRGVRADSNVTTGQFAGLFLRGNPLAALWSLIRYRRAKDERATVSMTEQLGETDSPLTVDELLETLSDPRFFVRFEAIVSIARRDPDPRLMEALVKVLNGEEPALSTVAAWALGRIGDEHALQPLRAGLDARYRSVQAHSARSLGTLGDVEIAPVLLERLQTETDAGLQIAYAAALGKLEAERATDRLLALLHDHEDPGARPEVALALARIVGDEHHFIQLMRGARGDIGTVTSQAVTGFKNAIGELEIESCDAKALVDECADAFGRQELERGVPLLCDLIRCLPMEEFGATYEKILQDCAARLDEHAAERREYLLLALHTLHVGLSKNQPSALDRVLH